MSRIVLFLSSFVQTLKTIGNEILNNNWYLLFSTLFLFSLITILFLFSYVFINQFQKENITLYKEMKIKGMKNYLPAFRLSDNLKALRIIEAKNDLYLKDLGFETIPNWMMFSQDRSLQREIPNEANHWDSFQDKSVLGKKPSYLIEKIFPKYGFISFKVKRYIDNSLTELLPFLVLRETYDLDIEQTRALVIKLQTEPNNLYSRLVSVANKIKNEVFKPGTIHTFGTLNSFLLNTLEDVDFEKNMNAKFKEVFYGELLKIFGSYQVTLEFDFKNIEFEPNMEDLAYLSIMNATSNPPQDIFGVTLAARLLCWVHVLISYFLLAFIVAVIFKFLRLS